MHFKKRPIALLEVLIALSMILLCVGPLVKQPLANHQAEMAQATRIEEGRMAACAFVEVREMFLKKQIRWKQLPKLKGVSAPFALSDAPLQLPPFGSKPIKRSYVLKTLSEKQESNGKTFRLIAVCFTFGKNKFTYRLTVFKEGLEPQKKEEPISLPEAPK